MILKIHKKFIRNNKSILQIEQSEGHNVFTDEINNFALHSNGNKRMQ